MKASTKIEGSAPPPLKSALLGSALALGAIVATVLLLAGLTALTR